MQILATCMSRMSLVVNSKNFRFGNFTLYSDTVILDGDGEIYIGISACHPILSLVCS